MSIERAGRWTAMPQEPAGATPGGATPGGATPLLEIAPEVIEFIRFCYQRRRIGWPELYDEMCGAAARGEFRGMDYDRLAALGVGFSLGDMPRLAALAQRVVADERRRRVAIRVGTGPDEVAAPAPALRTAPLPS